MKLKAIERYNHPIDEMLGVYMGPTTYSHIYDHISMVKSSFFSIGLTVDLILASEWPLSVVIYFYIKPISYNILYLITIKHHYVRNVKNITNWDIYKYR